MTDALLQVDDILELHESTVALWHQQEIANTYSGVLELVCKQHIFNYELWHQEDIARAKDVSDDQIATVKREIDRLNQARNDHIEKLDDWITEELGKRQVSPTAQAKLNTETPGSAVDRLSIMALRLYHYEEQLERDDASSDHVQKVRQRIDLCKEQRSDLAQSLKELLADISAGNKLHKTYRQMKMYNDPTLNPYLYKAAQARRTTLG
jgi:cell division protein FtsB